jgi:hypothetical protein
MRARPCFEPRLVCFERRRKLDGFKPSSCEMLLSSKPSFLKGAAFPNLEFGNVIVENLVAFWPCGSFLTKLGPNRCVIGGILAGAQFTIDSGGRAAFG